MNYKKPVPYVLAWGCLMIALTTFGQQVKPPIMGWSSWNNFRVHIDEKMIRAKPQNSATCGFIKI